MLKPKVSKSIVFYLNKWEFRQLMLVGKLFSRYLVGYGHCSAHVTKRTTHGLAFHGINSVPSERDLSRSHFDHINFPLFYQLKLIQWSRLSHAGKLAILIVCEFSIFNVAVISCCFENLTDFGCCLPIKWDFALLISAYPMLGNWPSWSFANIPFLEICSSYAVIPWSENWPTWVLQVLWVVALGHLLFACVPISR